MNKTIYAALIGIAVSSAPVAVSAQVTQPYGYNSYAQDAPYSPTPDAAAVSIDSPRPSSLGNWPSMNEQTAAVPTPYSAAEPRPSSTENWPGMTGSADPAYGSSADPSFAGARPGPAH